MPNWPDDEALLRLIEQAGSQAAAARSLGVSASSLKSHVDNSGLRAKVDRTLGAVKLEQAHGVKVEDEQVTVTLPSGQNPALGDYGEMLKERGLDPDDWVVVSAKANEWDGMTGAESGNKLVRMKQWTITLKPSVRKLLLAPAVHVPPVKRTRIGPPPSELPETVLIESDHHCPNHDPDLDQASLHMIADLAKKHRLAEQIFLGDTMDLATISRHGDHPATQSQTPQINIQTAYDMLRRKREAAPNIRARKVKGNHDWRIDSEQLSRAERMYGIAPAQRWEDAEPEIAALHLRRLLHLDELGIELVEDPRGWEHAEIEIVPGVGGLVCRHGWVTGTNVAEKSVRKRGRSIVCGHAHRREHWSGWDASAGVERQGVVAGIMARRNPHYFPLDDWAQGCVIVTRWPDQTFAIEHVRWTGSELRWRDKAWRAA